MYSADQVYDKTVERVRRAWPNVEGDRDVIACLAEEIEQYRAKIETMQAHIEELQSRPKRYDDELRMCQEELRVCNSDREMLKDTIVRMAMQLTGGGR